jgi:hypothetical protein
MKYHKNLNWYLRQRQARLNDIRKTEPFMAGSLVAISKRCGNKQCKCMRGEKHRGYYITSKYQGKTRTQYVPIGMYEAVRNWTVEYRVLKDLIKEMTKIHRMILKRYVKEKGRKAVWDKK